MFWLRFLFCIIVRRWFWMVLRAELWSVLLDGPSEIVPAFELVLIDAQLLVEHVVLFHLAFRNIRGVAFLSWYRFVLRAFEIFWLPPEWTLCHVPTALPLFLQVGCSAPGSNDPGNVFTKIHTIPRLRFERWESHILTGTTLMCL